MIARLLAAFFFALWAHPVSAQTIEALHARLDKLADADRLLWVPMRDGIRLSTDVYLPKNRTGRVPVILFRTPYNYRTPRRLPVVLIEEALRRGYAFVLQNDRGAYYSEGKWEILGRPRQDGADMLDWLARQPWSSGQVGATGCSSAGEWLLPLSDTQHPALRAIAPMASGAGIGAVGPYVEQGNFYRGGAERLFYPVWMIESLQPEVRPLVAPELDQAARQRLARQYDLDARNPGVDWNTVIKTLPAGDVLERAGLPRALWNSWKGRTPADPAWRRSGLWFDDKPIGVPTLWINSWFDVAVAPNLAAFNHARARSPRRAADGQFAIVGPNLHCRFFAKSIYGDGGEPKVGEVGARNFPNAALDLVTTLFDFFDRYVANRNNWFEHHQPRVQFYEMGADRWRTSAAWPPAETSRLTLYLDAQSGANSVYGDGALGSVSATGRDSDSFVYDPMHPVPTLGGGVCCIGDTVAAGIFDQRPVEARADVLVYTGDALPAGLRLAGPVDATLFVSSDAPDTDVFVKLVDVAPDGTATNIVDTMQRLRWRNGYSRQAPWLEKSRIYEIVLQPMVTSYWFKPGHRVRLQVTSSSFPDYVRNLNTAEPVLEQRRPLVARNVIHHSARYPSRISLTVAPEQPIVP